MSEKEKDIVTIRAIEPNFGDGDIVAFIWNADTNAENVMSYMTVGQHSEATLEFHDEETRGLRYVEEIEKAQDLIAELRSIGYKI